MGGQQSLRTLAPAEELDSGGLHLFEFFQTLAVGLEVTDRVEGAGVPVLLPFPGEHVPLGPFEPNRPGLLAELD